MSIFSGKVGRLAARFFLALALVLGVTLGSAAVNSEPASASSTGCSYPWFGQYCETVNGSGTYVENVHGSFSSRSPICNWRLKATFYNANNQYWAAFYSDTHWGCSYVNWDTIWLKLWAPRGYVCLDLQSNSNYVTHRCASIY